jgi:4-carboxymuconolactone decarboxylase
LPRLPDLDPAALTPEQKLVYDEVAAAHNGNVRGPWAIALRDPDVLHHTHELYERLCRNTKLGLRLFELMVLVVARQWSSQFEWHTHEKYALEGGITPEVIDAIRHRRTPVFARDDERLVYDTITELSESKTLSAESYERARAFFGEELLVELIAAAGLYTMVAMMLNAFDAPVPDTMQRLT